MGNKVRMSGFLPGEEKNGLIAHEDEFLGVDAPEPVLAIVQLERKQRAVDDDTDDVKVSVRITALEVLDGDDAKSAAVQLLDLRGKRTGSVTLDVDGAE